MAVLSDDDIAKALEDLEGWGLEAGAITKEFAFPAFLDAIAFVDRIAEAAEEMNHHPDLEIHYDRVRVALRTHSEDGVTDRDTRLAHEIEALSDVGF